MLLLVHMKYGRKKKKKTKKEKNLKPNNMEESSQNLRKESHNLQLLNIPNKEECL